MRLYQICVEIYEGGTDYKIPIVVHLFQGRTRKEALGYHDAHRRADSFLRECEDKSCFAKKVACRTKVSEGWVDR